MVGTKQLWLVIYVDFDEQFSVAFRNPFIGLMATFRNLLL